MSNTNFKKILQSSLPCGVDLEPEIWTFIEWLEDRDQVFQYRNSDEYFVPTIPIANFDSVWSSLMFAMVPDLVKYWFGKDGLENQVVPFVRCGGDGSYLAVWRSEGLLDHYVFLGSEGEAFVVANNTKDFLCLLTMGYSEIENREDLEIEPDKNNWLINFETPCSNPMITRDWTEKTFSIQYPKTGIELMPKYDKEDPFIKFVEKQIKS